MSTVAPTMTVTDTPPTPFLRLVRVELRKTWDTRSGLWLLISTAVLTAAVMAIQLAVVVSQDLVVTYQDFLTSTNFSIAILLPVLGILLVTSEWSQRTAMVTFSLEPRRPKIIAAKLAVAIALAVGAVLVALVLAAVCNLLYGVLTSDPVVWDSGVASIAGFLLFQILGMLTGFALATLLLSSPAAIVVFMVYSFVVPTLIALGAQLMDWFDTISPWIDFGSAQGPLTDASMSGEDWAHLAVSGLIWLVLPLVVGLRRVLRAEVK